MNAYNNIDVDFTPSDWVRSDETIKVIGVGGGGCNAVSYMYPQKITGCSFIVCNTDSQALAQSPVPVKIQLGKGLGAGTDPTKGRNAAIEAQSQIEEVVLNGKTRMLFITAGMGGGTGTGASPVIAKMAKDKGILTVAVVTLPFKNEGNESMSKAIDGIRELEKNVDSLLIINNEKLYDFYGNLLVQDAFPKTDDVLLTAVRGIVEIIKKPGYITVDFQDVETMMRSSGMALMGCGTGTGRSRLEEAVKAALESPLLNDFDLGLANAFMKTPLNLQGLLTGQGEAFALLGPEKGILLNLRGSQISAAGVDVGDLRIESNWDDPGKQFRFLVDNTLAGRHPLNATGSLRPKDQYATLDLQLDQLQIGMLEPLLASLVSDVGGSVSGHVTASGPLSKLSLKSENTRLNQLKFKLLYTQVDYTADGPFTIGDKGVTFDNITILDPFEHKARLSGGIPYDHFQNLRLDTRIDLQNVMALNTTSRDNDTFYGKAFADGTIRLSGPLDKIRLFLTVTPMPNTSIHIPVGNSAKSTRSLLTFINNEEKKVELFDSLVLAKQMIKEKKSSSKSELTVNLRLNATPDAEIQLEIDKSTGDSLKARGTGEIGITAGGDNFDIKGDYRVDSGSYHFGMLGFTARDFSINPGGTISFVGDVMQSDLDMTATYRTKASISPLIADSTAVSTRRTVDCGISLSGKLSNPEIKFIIDVPDLDPTTLSRVQTALNTEDKRMKQALALLVSGGFVPDEQSGIVNSTTLLYSNASEMMASQLNNILRQLDIPIDLGFNYQPTDNGRNIFDVAVSTQLFNNRVSINGNIGNRQYMSSSASDIVGDLDIEIKLNRQGQLRLTLFSHSADQYSNYLDQSQRNGAGIVYQEDFNTIGELWRKIFHIKTDERETLPDSNPPRRPRPE